MTAESHAAHHGSRCHRLARAAHLRRAEDDGHVQLDARLSRQFGSARLFIDLTNIGDADYLDVAGLAAPSRAVHVGFEWRWRR